MDENPCRELAPVDDPLPHARLPNLRPAGLGTSPGQPDASFSRCNACVPCRKALIRTILDVGRSGGDFCGPSIARRIGRLGGRTQGLAVRGLFLADIGGVCWLARRPFSPLRYCLVVVCFALALLAKPMAVSLPLVLLVLDFWPLRRTQTGRWSALLLEKLPLVAMSAALCAKTLAVQHEAVELNAALPLSARALNALVSYQAYIVKTFCPTGLAAHYPFPRQFSLPTVAVAAGLLSVITIVAILLRRSRPYLLAGWLWYLGMLVPVIGLVQVGRQSMADRYTYFPQIGLLAMIVFTAADLLAARTRLHPAASAVLALVLSLLAADSWRQTKFWHDDIAFVQRALDCNEDDSEMHNNMAAALINRSDLTGALSHAKRAVELDVDSATAQANLAKVLTKRCQYRDAIDHAKKSVELAPGCADFHFIYGNALALDRRYQESVPQFQEAIRLQPDQRLYSDQLARVLTILKQPESHRP